MTKQNGTTLKIRVVPNSKKFSIGEKNPWTGELKIKLAAKPVKGAANKELLKELKRMLNADVRILLGENSTEKTVFIEGKTSEEVEKALKQ